MWYTWKLSMTYINSWCSGHVVLAFFPHNYPCWTASRRNTFFFGFGQWYERVTVRMATKTIELRKKSLLCDRLQVTVSFCRCERTVQLLKKKTVQDQLAICSTFKTHCSIHRFGNSYRFTRTKQHRNRFEF